MDKTKRTGAACKTYGEVQMNYQCFILTSISSTTSHHLGLWLDRHLVQYILHNSNSPSNILASIIHIVCRSKAFVRKAQKQRAKFYKISGGAVVYRLGVSSGPTGGAGSAIEAAMQATLASINLPTSATNSPAAVASADQSR